MLTIKENIEKIKYMKTAAPFIPEIIPRPVIIVEPVDK